MKLSEIAKELEKLSVEELETLFFSYEEYEETPVGIDEFINSKEFLGESFPEGFYPYWMKELREIYPSPVYSPYWLIVLRGSIGRGKCLEENTRIPTSIGLKRIKELYKLYSSGIKFSVLSESGEKLVTSMVNDGIKPCITITTKRKSKITVGENHKFRVINKNGDIVWVRASDLNIGDNLIKSLKETPSSNIKLEDNLAWFVGALTGDGGITYRNKGKRNIIHFILNKDDYKDSYYRQSIEEGFSQFVGGLNNWCKGRNCFSLRKTSSEFSKYLLDNNFLGKEVSTSKRLPKLVPEFIFNASNYDKVQYLSGLVDTDGSVDKETGRIEISNSSEECIRGLASICYSLGLVVNVIPKKFKNREHIYWRLSIYNHRSLKRLNDLGFRPRLSYKYNRFIEILKTSKNGSNVRLNIDGFSPKLRELKEKLRNKGVKTDTRSISHIWGMSGNNENTTLDSVERISAEFQCGGLVPEFDFINNFSCYTDKIINIERLDAKVYDLSVDDDPSYIVEGFISHNTTLANVIIAYEIHKLLCLTNPQKKLDVAKHTRIVFMIMNMTLTLASSVVWDQLNQFFTNSPYFSARIDLNRKLKSKGTLFPKRIDIGIGSRIQHGMGQAVFSSLIDEAAFDVINNQVLKTFENLIARMQSRFMLKGGGVPGKIIVASSETEKGSALNKIVEDYRGKPGVYINAGPLWEIRPDKYCGETFPVFVGTDARQPEIIGENNKELLTIEAANIENVPIEHKDRFDVDIYESLRNLAGRSITSSYKFIGLRDRLTNILTVNSIFPDTLRLDFDNKEDNIQKHLKLKDYFVVPVQALSPRYLHIDIGISGDRLGIACGVITSFEERSFRDNVTLDIKYETSPKIQIEWCIGIEAIHGKQIPLYKVREFIIWMTRQGYRIGKITLDGYQCLNENTFVPTNRGVLPLREVKVGDMVESRSGIKKVLNKWEFGEQSTLKIKTTEGLELEGTGIHKIEIAPNLRKYNGKGIPSWNKPKWEWVKLEDVKIGDIVRIKSTKEIQNDKLLDLIPIIKKYENKNIGSSNIGKLRNWEIPKKLTPKFAEFLGLIWGDGSVDRDGLKLHGHIDEIKDYQKLCKEVFNIEFPIVKGSSANCKTINISGRFLVRWLKLNGLLKYQYSEDLFIPELIWKSPRQVQASFLRGLFSADGCVHTRDGKITLATQYKKLAQDVCTMLNMVFGIRARITNRNCKSSINSKFYPGYMVNISGDRSKFLEIGFLVKQKQEKLEKHKNIKGEFRFSRVKSIEASRAKVIDIQVEDDPSYIANGFVSHNSTDMIQLLKVNNYNAGLLSVDKTTLPYISLREITYDNRLLLPKNEILKREMFELEMNAKGDMVDHPEKNTDGTKGSKDIADSVCGVVYNLIQDANKYRTVSSVIKTGVMTKTDQNIMNQFGEAWKNAKK